MMKDYIKMQKQIYGRNIGTLRDLESEGYSTVLEPVNYLQEKIADIIAAQITKQQNHSKNHITCPQLMQEGCNRQNVDTPKNWPEDITCSHCENIAATAQDLAQVALRGTPFEVIEIDGQNVLTFFDCGEAE